MRDGATPGKWPRPPRGGGPDVPRPGMRGYETGLTPPLVFSEGPAVLAMVVAWTSLLPVLEAVARLRGDSATGERLLTGPGVVAKGDLRLLSSAASSDPILKVVMPLSADVARDRPPPVNERPWAAEVEVLMLGSGVETDRGLGCLEKSGEGTVLGVRTTERMRGVLGSAVAASRSSLFSCVWSLRVSGVAAITSGVFCILLGSSCSLFGSSAAAASGSRDLRAGICVCTAVVTMPDRAVATRGTVPALSGLCISLSSALLASPRTQLPQPSDT